MEHIVPGRTSEREAVEILGPPSRTANKDDGTKLLWWTYSKQESKDTSVFLLLNSDDSRKFQESVLLCVKDGVVSDMRTE
jgi:hypothetical protein